MTEVTVRYWAGARRAAGLDSEQLSATDLADLLSQLGSRPELGKVIAASSVLVNELRPSDENQLLPAGAVVDILPPFAGG